MDDYRDIGANDFERYEKIRTDDFGEDVVTTFDTITNSGPGVLRLDPVELVYVLNGRDLAADVTVVNTNGYDPIAETQFESTFEADTLSLATGVDVQSFHIGSLPSYSEVTALSFSTDANDLDVFLGVVDGLTLGSGAIIAQANFAFSGTDTTISRATAGGIGFRFAGLRPLVLPPGVNLRITAVNNDTSNPVDLDINYVVRDIESGAGFIYGFS